MIDHQRNLTAAALAAGLLLAGCAARVAWSQAGVPGTLSYESGAAASGSVNAGQNPFTGSVPSGKATTEVVPLSLKDAIERSLKYNLGILLSEQSTAEARGARWVALGHLLPQLNGGVTESRQEINLEALGFPANKFAGFPVIVGPFNTFDARAYLKAPVLDLHALRNDRAARADILAAQYTYQDARNMVVLVAGNAYLLADAGKTRVKTAQTEVSTAQALYKQAVDRFHAGLAPQIDVLRAEVELKGRQQQLIAARNDLATAKLNLARVCGLPDGQEFTLTTPTQYTPIAGVTVEKALADAYAHRSDYKAALAAVTAANQRRRAVLAERYPSVSFDANFGDIGLTPSNSHETFTAAGSVNIPIFQGGRIHGELLEANANLKRAEEQAQNLKEQIAYDVRTALLNLKTASDQVEVAQSNVALAHQTLEQARDRFAAGVTDNIEVVEAQEALATANESYISSLYQDNLAKVALARAAGIAESAVLQYLGGK
ncbi:MAG: TolC family protein [Acidobacteriota bacterium]|nr:TolC family protein [Acidobacteriota bacterium]